jgi:hypothetical protein
MALVSTEPNPVGSTREPLRIGALPYLKRLPGKKVLIGDNLVGHLSFLVVKKCEQYNILFTLLPPNATHILQPLDIAVFHPLKAAWRAVLQKWR